MGRLISPSKPKAVEQPVVYYTPAPTPAPAATTADSEEEVIQTPEEVAAARAENLLRRNRSRLGTVLTSFRGVLSQNDLATSRKTLLGE